MRCFIAIYPDADLLTALQGIRRELAERPQARKLRWIRANQLHLTLCFLGEFSDALLGPMTARLQESISGLAPFEVPLGGVAPFPRPDSALLAACFTHTTALAELHGTVCRVLDTMEVDYDRKPLLPHITLARAPRRGGRCDLSGLRMQCEKDTPPLRVERIAVVRSVPVEGGMHHETVATVALVGKN